jgi:hypothetical protein
MIRFYKGQLVERNDLDIHVASEHILAGEDLWDTGKAYFRKYVSDDAVIRLLPVADKKEHQICYAYQDSEANRELRMLKELSGHQEALQFQDIYPEIKEVIVCGCNELAFRFVRYLEEQQISVKVAGKYWEYFGYESSVDFDGDESHKLVIYAEELLPTAGGLYQNVITSVSPVFECIDRIYETNISEGRIKDTKGNLEEILEKLRGKAVVLLGTDVNAQDTYDFLYGKGIDICCFAECKDTEMRNIHRTLLGKNVVVMEEIMKNKPEGIVIECSDKNSALGTENLELFDYYGYVRNEQFILLRDYAEVPCSNLLHVLKGKKVLFAGDERLCEMMSEFLFEKEQGDIETVYVELSQCKTMKATDILCVVNPWFDLASLTMTENPKAWCFRETLSKEGIVSYTDYFAQVRTLVDVDLYRNRGREKYAIGQLNPKGILLGRIEAFSGNVFFRGVLDGHPDILHLGYTIWNNNLLLYCIRLAGEKSEKIFKSFKRMCNEEFAFRLEEEFICWDTFEKSLKRLLSLKEAFTSQELFVIFHIAFAEMVCGYKITGLDQKIIYWEPHMFLRENFPFLAKWLESEQINGQTVCMHRDMLVRAGSMYNHHQLLGLNDLQPILNVAEIVDDTTYEYWEEFHVRFEDIKLHPQKELSRICGRLGISWSDTLLKVTEHGEIYNYLGIFNFEIKPVFNKYEEWLSEFDRFRISVTNSLFQKKYGYTYEDCMMFSRKELQEMFLKEFRFQKKLRFAQERDRTAYFLRTYRRVMNRLWEVRKSMVIHDIVPVFGEIELGNSTTKKKKKADIANQKELGKLLEFVRGQERLVLYGTGKDCEGLLKHLEEAEQSNLIFSDLKAEYTDMTFHGRKVVAPRELCETYRDYKILITSSKFHEGMRQWLEDRGVAKDRITCNIFRL